MFEKTKNNIRLAAIQDTIKNVMDAKVPLPYVLLACSTLMLASALLASKGNVVLVIAPETRGIMRTTF